jgi:pimeloyl-ACP methyl ester carboxylesterase
MKPIVLIHGYSAESTGTDLPAIQRIYGDLPGLLRQNYNVVEIDLSRYVSLNDSLTVQDIARALNRALVEQHSDLLKDGFHVVIHSTGALAIRTWIQLFSSVPSPVRNLVYLAGANLGSGWARIGQGQVARWGRFVFERGAQRGVKVLQALEFGSGGTIDMHLRFLTKPFRMFEDYQVQEFVIIGTQADPSWFEFPVRYAHEDGSDGVIRVSATNLNFNHVVIGPDTEAATLPWAKIEAAIEAAKAKADFPEYYEVKSMSFAGADRPIIPFGIVYQCAHTGDKMGIVSGSEPREQVLRMLKTALETPERSTADWQNVAPNFERETKNTFDSARTMQRPGPFTFLSDPRNQYDPHAQVVFRLFDQDGLPVAISSADIFFVSNQQTRGTTPIQELIEDTVVSAITPNSIVFYLRVNRFDKRAKDWVDQLETVSDFAIEITAVEPVAPAVNPLVTYLPLRIPLSKESLKALVQPHRTTIFDVTLVRVSSPDLYQLVTLPKV